MAKKKNTNNNEIFTDFMTMLFMNTNLREKLAADLTETGKNFSGTFGTISKKYPKAKEIYSYRSLYQYFDFYFYDYLSAFLRKEENTYNLSDDLFWDADAYGFDTRLEYIESCQEEDMSYWESVPSASDEAKEQYELELIQYIANNYHNEFADFIANAPYFEQVIINI